VEDQAQYLYKMKFFLTAITILLLTSCTHRDRIIVQDVSLEDVDSSDKDVLAPPPPINPTLLKGAWTDGSTDNATFSFNKNRIYYLKSSNSYPFKLQADSITIKHEDYYYKAQIWLLNDTLTMRDKDGETKFWRFRK
jgi:hypothetical protein